MNSNSISNECEFPFEIKPIEPEINSQLLKDFIGEHSAFFQVGPNNYFFPSNIVESAKHFYNFQARPDDIWIVTFPRSGTTWTQELIWLIANELDYESTLTNPLTKRFPFFEFSLFVHNETKQMFLEENKHDPEKCEFIEKIARPGYEYLNEMKSPRFIKTHFPFSLLPPSIFHQNCKIIYVARNSMDVSVSCYHQNRLLRTQGYMGDFNKYWKYFSDGLTPYGPHWKHIEEGWKQRNNPNVLFIFYENLNKNLPGNIKSIAKFLNKEISELQIESLCEHLSITNFRNNTSVNGCELKEVRIMKNGEQGFVRQGKTCGNIEFTPELKSHAIKWIQKNSNETNIQFPIHDMIINNVKAG